MLPVLATKAAAVLIAGWLAVSGAQAAQMGKGQKVANYVVREIVNGAVKYERTKAGLEKPKPRKPKEPKTSTDILADLFGQWVRFYRK